MNLLPWHLCGRMEAMDVEPCRIGIHFGNRIAKIVGRRFDDGRHLLDVSVQEYSKGGTHKCTSWLVFNQRFVQGANHFRLCKAHGDFAAPRPGDILREQGDDEEYADFIAHKLEMENAAF